MNEDTRGYAHDEDGDRYQEFWGGAKTPHGDADVQVRWFEKDPGSPGQPKWFSAFYSVIPSDDAGVGPVAMEWHRPENAFYVGAVGYKLMSDATGAALAISRARKGKPV
jgi:hypothetical protein